MFPVEKYKWHTSIALIKNDKKHAEEALRVAQIEKSGFQFHQKVGLVGKEHENTIKLLQAMCA